ncbi:response regulator [Roseivivax halodurans JCM 10272]|uniref:Response regulator n=1 Tax=Roseivivax halodurans JCM 10272 TaxID=1449350 RepID=X7EL15_9RHOB|nr:response regulator [Roseivivax halodurans]ETX15851.1 response regulator [Roseivivax halodurans JCM 10272]
MDDHGNQFGVLRPTPARPFLGLTVLMVEDSRFACDALRLVCTRSGARIRRADCLRSARRHLEVYRPSVAIIDMGLPDGSGAELISELAAAEPRLPVILAISGDPGTEHAALAAGADDFLAKPVRGIGKVQAMVLKHLPAEWRPHGPRLADATEIRPDPVAYRDDMLHVADLLDASNEATLDYAAQFLTSVAQSAGDTPLAAAAEQWLEARRKHLPSGEITTRIARLVEERTEACETV